MRKAAIEAGAFDAVPSMQWALGGKGAVDLANAVVRACSQTEIPSFKFLYDLNLGIREKINIIVKEMYGGDGIEFSDLALKKVDVYTRQVRTFDSIYRIGIL